MAKLLLVADLNVARVGVYFQRAAQALGFQTQVCDVRQAYAGPWILKQVNWRLRGHRPFRLEGFSRQILEACQEFKPQWLLSTGIAPLSVQTLKALGTLRIRRLNYLTDDPWNPAHRAPWFMDSLPLYDRIFSPRRSNLEQLKRIGCQAGYLPFAYDPTDHHAEKAQSSQEQRQFESDVVFAGAADPDRIRFVSRLIQSGFQVHLYGTYWDRGRWTRAAARPFAGPKTLRLAVGGAKVALCLVRRANRDDNSMRTFEVPAMGGCLLVEETQYHRELFGKPEQNVCYFKTALEAIEKIQFLLKHPETRERLRSSVHELICKGGHTYQDRLAAILKES